MVDRFLQGTDSGVSTLHLRRSCLDRIGCMITRLSPVGSFLLHTGFEMERQGPLRSDRDLRQCNPAGRSSVGRFPVDRGISRMAVGRLCNGLARPICKCRSLRNVLRGILRGMGQGCSQFHRRRCPSRSSGRVYLFPDRRRLGHRYPHPLLVPGPLPRDPPSSKRSHLLQLRTCGTALPRFLQRSVRAERIR